MTTIAWDGVRLAADPRMVSNYSAVTDNYNKLAEVEYKKKIYHVGFAGSMGQAQKFINHLMTKGFNFIDPPEVDDMEALLIIDKEVYNYEGSSNSYIYLGKEPCAIGSGADIALAGLRMGLNSEEAVLLASTVDLATNNNVKTLVYPDASCSGTELKSTSTNRKNRPPKS